MTSKRKLNFNWRLVLVQIITNALALGLTALLLPGIHFHPQRIVLSLLASGLIFGVLNAFVRPVLQFVMFRFLFITFGLVLIVINLVMLWLLGRLTPGWFQSDGFWWTILAAILVGLLGVFFETLLGLRPPLRDDRPEARSMTRWFSLSGAPVHIPTFQSTSTASVADHEGEPYGGDQT